MISSQTSGSLPPLSFTTLSPSEQFCGFTDGPLRRRAASSPWEGSSLLKGGGQPYMRFRILQAGCLSLVHSVFMAPLLRTLWPKSSCRRLGWVPSTEQNFSHDSSTRALCCVLHQREETNSTEGCDPSHCHSTVRVRDTDWPSRTGSSEVWPTRRTPPCIPQDQLHVQASPERFNSGDVL
jgi:hypothetical protein